MAVRVREIEGGYRIDGDWDGLDAANAFLAHLSGRGFSPATVRAYAFDVREPGAVPDRTQTSRWPRSMRRWCSTGSIGRECAAPSRAGAADRVRPDSAAASTVNRRVAAVRALFEYLVMAGGRTDNPVPSPRRGQGLRRSQRGLLGHLGPGRARGGGRLVRQPRLLPESLPASDVDAFLASLATHRDRAMVLAMLLGGLRSAEVRGLLLADVDMGRRRLRVIGKGGKERSCAGRCGVLHRARRLPAVGAPAGAGDTAVFRGAARPDHRCAGQRGRAAQPVPPPPGALRRHPGPPAPAAAYLRHRIGRRRESICSRCGR